MTTDYNEIDLNQVLQQRFSAGLGVVTLSPSLTDAQNRIADERRAELVR